MPNTVEGREEKGDEIFRRKRMPHVVPLGSIFVWTLEGMIMSMILLTVTLFMGGEAGMPNIADSAISSILVACNLVNMVGHLMIANAFNRESQASWAGGLHGALSNALCSITFVSTMTYIALYIDSCLLEVPKKDMCTLLFRNTPFPDIVLAIISSYLLIMFLVSVALAFVSSPQDTPSYTFVSKGGLLLSGIIIGWASPVANMAGRVGCTRSFEPVTSFQSLMAFGFMAGFAATMVEWLLGGLYTLRVKKAVAITHIVVDACVIVISAMATMLLMAGRNDTGSIGVLVHLILFLVVLVWCMVDITIGILLLTIWRNPTENVAQANQGIVDGIPLATAPEGSGIPYLEPPVMTMYMAGGSSSNSGMAKKADSLPPSMGPSPISMFASEEVRRSLRHRALPGPL